MKIFLTKKEGKATLWTVIFIALIPLLLIGGAFALYYFKGGKKLSTKDIAAAEKIIGLNFNRKERKMMLDNLKRNLSSYKELRKVPYQNHVPLALLFNPVVTGMSFEKEQKPFTFSFDSSIQIPENFEDLAFYPVTKLAPLIKSRKITSSRSCKG